MCAWLPVAAQWQASGLQRSTRGAHWQDVPRVARRGVYDAASAFKLPLAVCNLNARTGCASRAAQSSSSKEPEDSTASLRKIQRKREAVQWAALFVWKKRDGEAMGRSKFASECGLHEDPRYATTHRIRCIMGVRALRFEARLLHFPRRDLQGFELSITGEPIASSLMRLMWSTDSTPRFRE